jgi:hypothetical protein
METSTVVLAALADALCDGDLLRCYQCSTTDDLHQCVLCSDDVCADCAHSGDEDGAICVPCERRAREDHEARMDIGRMDYRGRA